MPLKFWDEAFLTATYLINLLPTKTLDYETHVHRLLNETPDYNSLRIFGCDVWPNLRPYNTRKLAFRSMRCAFLGYNSMHKGFKCLEPSSGRVYISRDVIFDESIFPFPSFIKTLVPFFTRWFFSFQKIFAILLTLCLLILGMSLTIHRIFMHKIWSNLVSLVALWIRLHNHQHAIPTRSLHRIRCAIRCWYGDQSSFCANL